MKLAMLIDGLPVRLMQGDPTIEIVSVVDDSRRVQPGCLFIARVGTRTNGARFIDDALARGAVAVLMDAAQPTVDRSMAAWLTATDLRTVSLQLADRLHGEPARRLTLLGVTGTNGKSTTAWLMHQMLQAAGHQAGLVSTTVIDNGASRSLATMTTPGAIELRSIMGSMVENGCTHAVIEVSSHAIDQGRVEGLDFAAAVFTNLSGDHLDYHKSMDAYAATKARWFEQLQPSATAVVNMDDWASARMTRECRANIVRCSMSDRTAQFHAAILAKSTGGTEVEWRGSWGSRVVHTPLVGAHNIMNLLQAAAACDSINIGADAIERAATNAKAPPGRLEPVTTSEHDFTVLVDYSHTDGALDIVLSELRPLVSAGSSLRTLFGCGGDRDTTKRPRMAQAALRHSDQVIITSDNPRSEEPRAIIDQILGGVEASQRDRVIVEPDRAKAIEVAIQSCRHGDVLVIAGKGHETYQIVGSVTRPFDDRVVAAQAIEKSHYKIASRA